MAKASVLKPVAKAPLQKLAAKPVPPVARGVPPWIDIARTYLGVHEGDGLHSNPKVLKFFLEAGHAEVHNDHTTPWCAAFVGAVLHEAGLPNTGTLWALDYAKYGQKIPLDKPAIGAIATKTRHGGGHVFFVVGFDKSRVWGLGGNQNDRVCVETFPRSVIHSLSWPPGVPLPTPHPASAGVTTGGTGGAREV